MSFRTDQEGFWYPEVILDLCVACGLCEKVCPMQHKADFIKRYEAPIVYAAYTKDEVIPLCFQIEHTGLCITDVDVKYIAETINN